MSKKIISIILTLAMILCQGTLCLGTVSAAEGEYIVEPVGYDVTLDADDWTPCQSGTSVHNNDDGELVFVNEGYKNDNKGRYDSGWLELRNISIDVRDYYAIEIITFVEDSKPLTKLDGTSYTGGNDTRVQFYFTGKRADGSDIKATEANSTGTQLGKYTVAGDAANGYYSEDYGIYSCELMGAWSEMETLTTLRMDALKNSSGTVRIKSIRLIGAPGISGIGFNSAYEADIDAMPVDPDTIDISIAGAMESIDGAVTITDPDGNEVPLTRAIIAGGKASLELAPGTELAEFTDYTVTFDTNTKLSSTKYLQEPISFTFTTDDSKAPNIFDAIDPDRPSDYTDDNIIWSAEFKNDSDADYIPSGSGVTTEAVYGEYLKYSTKSPVINVNGNIQGSFTDTKFSTALDANSITRLQIRMKVVDSVIEGTISGTDKNGNQVTKDRTAPRLQLYFAGVNDDGRTFVMDSKHGYLTGYQMTVDADGNNCTEWITFDINLNSIDTWVAARDITSMRFDFLNNCEGVALIDYIRLIGPKMPSIEGLKYNSEFELDEVQGLPINAESIEIYLSDPIFAVDASGIVLEDETGDAAAINNVILSADGKVVTVKPDEELNSFSTYYVGLNTNAKLSESANLSDYVVFETFTREYRAPSILDIVDPGRPDDSIPAGEEVYSLDFKDEDDLKFFKSTSNVKTSLKYGEYMEYKTESLGIGGTSGLPASYYIDSDFSNDVINSDMYYRLQIRMKVEKQVLGSGDGYFKMYFKGDNNVSMKEDNTDPVTYAYRTDEEGNYGTDWFTVDLDLSKSTAWKTASNITSIRFEFLKNVAGTVLVDYIRFIALPAVTELSYTNNAGTTVVGDGMTVAADTQYLNIKFSQKFPGELKYSLVNEYGTEANIDMNNTKYEAADNTLKLAILGGLETSSTYTLSIDSSYDFAQTDATLTQKLYRPLTYSFKTELDPITADVTKGADSTTINYANKTDNDAVLVAIATVWNGNAFVTKNISVTTVLANDTVNGVVVNHTLAAGETAEVVVMKYDAEKDSYAMISKVVH